MILSELGHINYCLHTRKVVLAYTTATSPYLLFFIFDFNVTDDVQESLWVIVNN